MKKISLILTAVIFIFCFTSCSKKADPLNLNHLYTVDVNVKHSDFDCTFTLTRLGNGMWDANFTAPQNINGMTASFENEDVKIGYKELTFSLPLQSLPAKTIFCLITKCLDAAAYNNDIEFTEDKEIITATGKVNDNDFKLYIDKKTDTIKSIEIKESNINAEFSNYTLKQ